MRCCATSKDLGWRHEDAAVNNRDIIDHDAGGQWNLYEFMRQCKSESRDLLLAWINHIIQGHHIFNMNKSQEQMLWGLFIKTKQDNRFPMVHLKFLESLWIWVGKCWPWNILNIGINRNYLFCARLEKEVIFQLFLVLLDSQKVASSKKNGSLNLRKLGLESSWKIIEFGVEEDVGTLKSLANPTGTKGISVLPASSSLSSFFLLSLFSDHIRRLTHCRSV